jgi:MFS family permease
VSFRGNDRRLRGAADGKPGRRRWWRTRQLVNLAPLRDREARRLIGAEFASLTGDGMVLTAMPIAVLSIGGNGFQLALALAAQAAGVAAMLPIAGVVGDRLPRRGVMVRADLLRFFPQIAIAVLLLTGDASYWHLLLAQVIHGIGTGLFMPASLAIVIETVGEERAAATNGLKQVGRAVAMIGAPAFGASACAIVGPGLAMAVDAGTFAASAALLRGLPVRAPRVGETTGFRRELRDGWRAWRSIPWLQVVTVQYTIVNALVAAPFYIFAPISAEGHFGGVDGWAFLLICLAAGEVIGGVGATSWRPFRPLVAGTVAMAVWMVPLVLLAILAPLPVVGFAMLAAGVGQGVFVPVWETTLQDQVEGETLARLSSFDMFGSLVFVPVGFAAGGIAEETIGATPGLLGAAGLLLVLSAVVLAFPCVRQLQRKDASAGASAAAGHSPIQLEGLAARSAS